MNKYYLVTNKPDDYDNCQKELVYTSAKNAKQYYSYFEVLESHAAVLMNYLTFLDAKEEKERTNDERFYGSE